MRQIKFRAWDKTKDRWLKSEYTVFSGIGSGVFLTLDSEILIYEYSSFIYHGIPDTRYILEQFTGAEDSKDVELYEGDIIVEYHHIWGKMIGVIYWDDDKHTWAVETEDHIDYQTLDDWVACEKIGTIHENPELLKKAS
jgi:uncharacterized phage protein (TIGR01671 family)